MKIQVDWLRHRTVVVVTQTLFGIGAMVLAVLPGLPWILVAMLGVVVSCGVAAGLRTAMWREGGAALSSPGWSWPRGLAWVGTLGYCAGAAWAWDIVEFWDPYYSWIAWFVAGLFVAGRGLGKWAWGPEWLKGPAWVWAFLGAWIWTGAAYMQDRGGAFHIGLALLLGQFIWLRLWFRLSAFEIQVANGAILLLILLPLADWLMAAGGSRSSQAPADRPYSFHVARQDPIRFAAWWKQYQTAWDRMAADVFMPDPGGEFAFRLRPNSEGYLMKSRITINSDGLRGKEIASAKGDTYRIVALGESTTFGCTLEAGDRPWPELLEELIRDRLGSGRSIEVINAGVPAYSLVENIKRFERDILPFEPDMIISYHGYNGFPMLRMALPQRSGVVPPSYTRRPSTLLARIEFRIESFRYERGAAAEPQAMDASIQTLLKTDYAERYRALIELTAAKGIRLVLCTFSMAVDRRSPRDVIEFYRPGFPAVHWQITANEAHSVIVRQLAREHPEVWLVETGRDLDGQHERYIDLVHFTQPGRRQLASNIFEGIAGPLRQEWPGH